MKLKPIRNVVKRTRNISPPSLRRKTFVYVDISSIDRRAKRISGPTPTPVAKAPSRARKEIRTNDVLVSTVRPNLNSVAHVPGKLDGEIASTGFCVLRPRADQLDSRYLFYFTQNSKFVRHLTRRAIGAGYPAVSDNDILDVEIPLPPLEEQKRIAGILARVDRVRQVRRFALRMTDDYLQAVFLRMFGDPVTNPMGWKCANMGSQIDSIRYGTGSPPPYQPSGIPFIRATNVKGGTIQSEDLAFISRESARGLEKCKVSAGNLIIVRSGVNSGDCALIPPHFNNAYAAYDLIVEVTYPKNYYYNFMINSDFGKAVIGPITRRAGQPHINAEQVNSLNFILPPDNLLEQFASLIKRVEILRAQKREAIRQADHLFDTLLHRAFCGEL